MIEAKYKYKDEDKFNYKEFESEEVALKAFEKDTKTVVQYEFRPKQYKSNPLKNYWNNLKNTKKNWGKVRASPYASLSFALKARKIIIGLLIPYIAYMIFNMVTNLNGSGPMFIFQRVFMIGMGVYMCWKIYQTIPQAQKQIDYYKKFPHLINYVPTDKKVSADDIINMIESNKQKGGSSK
jgi:hypothetical protein